MAHLAKRWKKKGQLDRKLTSFSGRGRNYIPKPFKGLADRHILPTWFFIFQMNLAQASLSSLPLWCHIPHLLAPPILFQLLRRDCIKINSHDPRSWKTKKTKKGVKSNILPLPSATHLSATSLWLSPRLSSKWRHTHARTHTLSYKNTHLHMHAQRNTRSQSLVEREGDANRGGFWTVAAISDYHEQMKPWYKVFSFKSPLFRFTSSENFLGFFFPSPLSPHNFWIFSATTMGFSLRMRAAAALR